MHDLETIVRMNRETQEKFDKKKAKKEEKLNQLRSAISRIMGDYTIADALPVRNYELVQELILNEVRIRFSVSK